MMERNRNLEIETWEWDCLIEVSVQSIKHVVLALCNNCDLCAKAIYV